jgi:hypothetical protein
MRTMYLVAKIYILAHIIPHTRGEIRHRLLDEYGKAILER